MTMNQLLAYVSYKGSGSMGEFFATCRTLGVEPPWVGLRNLSELGHLEYSWLEPSGWSVAPPVLALLPTAEPVAIVCGGRSPHLLQRLRCLPLSLEVSRQSLGPDIWRVKASSPNQLLDIAASAGLACSPAPPAWILARCLSPLAQYIWESCPSVPFPSTYTPHWCDPATGQFQPRPLVNQDGLWRYQERARGGRTRYLLRHGDQIRQVSDPDAVRLWLRPAGQSFARYDMATSSVLWRRNSRLPGLYARAFVLCSGQLPIADGDSVRYAHVPQALAMLVFGRLGLTAKEVAIA